MVPNLVVVEIILSMVFVPLGLFLNALIRYYSPYQRRIAMDRLTNAFCTSSLALTDVPVVFGIYCRGVHFIE